MMVRQSALAISLRPLLGVLPSSTMVKVTIINTGTILIPTQIDIAYANYKVGTAFTE